MPFFGILIYLEQRVNRVIFFTLFLGLIQPQYIWSEAIPVDEGAEKLVTLRELIEVAFRNNPSVKAARLKWKRVIQLYPQATAFDDPRISYILPIQKVETRLGPQNHIVKLSQKLPLWGKRALKGEVVKNSVQIAKTEYDSSVRNLLVAVKKSYYELFYIQRALTLSKGNLEVLERFETVGAADYEKDVTSLGDVLKAQSQYAQASYDLILLEELGQVEVTRLNTLLNREPDTRIGPLEEPAPQPFTRKLEELYREVTRTEELQKAMFTIEQKRVLYALSKYTKYPDFNVGFSYINVGDPPMAVADSGRDSFQLMLGMNIPLWKSKNSAVIEEALIQVGEAERARDSLKNELINRVKNQYFKVNNSYRLMELYEKNLIPQARGAISIAETLYKNDEGSLSGLLETQSIYFNFQTAYYRAFTDYLKAIADLEKITGIKFD